MRKFTSNNSFPIGTFNYNLARFLCDLLSPLVPNDYPCKDTFSFVSEIKNANHSWKFIVSYDVTVDLKSFLVYKFTCASRSSSYVSETCCHFKTKIEEHIKNENKSDIFKQLHSTATCFDSYNSLCFKIIHKANSKFDLKIKGALHINPSSTSVCKSSLSEKHETWTTLWILIMSEIVFCKVLKLF